MNASRPDVGSSANSNGGLVSTWKFEEHISANQQLINAFLLCELAFKIGSSSSSSSTSPPLAQSSS